MNDQKVQEILVEDIIPNRFQPRLTFDEKALQELSDSIKVHGVIQPLVLRKVGNKYEIIAGERRYKASCMAGLKTVPAIVREMTDNESAEVALIENVQRKNLSSIEEAQSYKNLLSRGYLTQEELAKKLGVAQSTIANKMRLLNLCDEVQNALLGEQISERHARSLLQLSNPDEQKKMLDRVIKERLTVKQLDNEIKKLLNGEDSSSGDAKVIDVLPSNEESGGNVMNNVDLNQGNNEGTVTTPLMEPNKNIFGFSIETPTDLEASAPNLSTGLEEQTPPPAFNPFGGDVMSNIDAPSMDTLVQPLGATAPGAANSGIEPAAQASAPKEEKLETFDMFGDVIAPETPVNNVPLNPFGPQESVVPQATPEASIGSQINNIRDVVKDTEQAGFRVEMEEYDFEDMYQITIKIKK